jgi:asparagine synthase (glutamine-hydrolysing)
MMRQILPHGEKIKTFSAGFGYGEESDELKYSRLASQRFETDHKEIIIDPAKIRDFPKIAWHMDEPISDPAIIPVYFLSKSAKENVSVVLTGDGADEILAGYEQHKFLAIHDKLRRFKMLREKLIPAAINAMPYSILNKFFKYSRSLGEKGKQRAISMLTHESSLNAYMDIVSIFSESEKKHLLNFNSAGLLDTGSQIGQYFNNASDVMTNTLIAEMKSVLPEDYLMKADKMTLANAVEERVPFLDHRLVEFSFMLPNSLKLRNTSEKYILKKAMKPYLPREILQRKKQRFYVPIDIWIRNELKPLFESTFSAESLSSSKYFERDFVQNLLDKYDRSPLFYGRQLWNVFSFEIWRRIFIEEEKFSIQI